MLAQQSQAQPQEEMQSLLASTKFTLTATAPFAPSSAFAVSHASVFALDPVAALSPVPLQPLAPSRAGPAHLTVNTGGDDSTHAMSVPDFRALL